MAAKNETRRSSKQSPAPNPNALPRGADPAGQRQVEREVIARKAYERYEKRGREPGRDQEDWLEAERELKNGHPA